MKQNNVIQAKSYAFAIRMVKLYQHLTKAKQEFVLSKQALRSGTAIGANVEEAIGGQTRADFIAKLSVAYKEARETNYWLRLLKDTGYLKANEFGSIYADAQELCKIMVAILKSSKSS
ncbi:MAG: four helix bundle protein [Pirellulales bacterium]|nr:four helix bundle protein [Pirellulales bacterium]